MLRLLIAMLKTEVAALPARAKGRETKLESASYSLVELILEMARRGRTQELADYITLDSGDEEEAKSLYTQLPEGLRGQYADAKHLLAGVVALVLIPPDTSGPVVTKEPAKDKSTVAFHLELHGIPPTSDPPPLACVFRRTRDGKWRLVVSSTMMDSYRQALKHAVEK